MSDAVSLFLSMPLCGTVCLFVFLFLVNQYDCIFVLYVSAFRVVGVIFHSLVMLCTLRHTSRLSTVSLPGPTPGKPGKSRRHSVA